jgi:hypothetical protein
MSAFQGMTTRCKAKCKAWKAVEKAAKELAKKAAKEASEEAARRTALVVEAATILILLNMYDLRLARGPSVESNCTLDEQ